MYLAVFTELFHKGKARDRLKRFETKNKKAYKNNSQKHSV